MITQETQNDSRMIIRTHEGFNKSCLLNGINDRSCEWNANLPSYGFEFLSELKTLDSFTTGILIMEEAVHSSEVLYSLNCNANLVCFMLPKSLAFQAPTIPHIENIKKFMQHHSSLSRSVSAHHQFGEVQEESNNMYTDQVCVLC